MRASEDERVDLGLDEGSQVLPSLGQKVFAGGVATLHGRDELGARFREEPNTARLAFHGPAVGAAPDGQGERSFPEGGLVEFEVIEIVVELLEDGRVLIQKDEGGNERHQLYLVDPAGSTPPEPLVYEPEFMHLDPQQSRDGSLLAYACNRRNGLDFDVFVRDLSTGDERTIFAPGGMTVPTGFSPDGRWLSTERLTAVEKPMQ